MTSVLSQSERAHFQRDGFVLQRLQGRAGNNGVLSIGGSRSDGSGYFAGRILREILNYSRRDQERFLRRAAGEAVPGRTVRVGYQGDSGSLP